MAEKAKADKSSASPLVGSFQDLIRTSNTLAQDTTTLSRIIESLEKALDELPGRIPVKVDNLDQNPDGVAEPRLELSFERHGKHWVLVLRELPPPPPPEQIDRPPATSRPPVPVRPLAPTRPLVVATPPVSIPLKEDLPLLTQATVRLKQYGASLIPKLIARMKAEEEEEIARTRKAIAILMEIDLSSLRIQNNPESEGK